MRAKTFEPKHHQQGTAVLPLTLTGSRMYDRIPKKNVTSPFRFDKPKILGEESSWHLERFALKSIRTEKNRKSWPLAKNKNAQSRK